MKKFYPLFVLLSLLFSFVSKSQINPGLVSTFGIDGDISSGQRLTGTFNAASTDDWFFKTQASNSGRGVIDTAGASYIKTILQNGGNPFISKGMNYPRYSLQGGKLFMDARYVRDNIGLSGTVKDSTVFTSGSKNGMSPSAWITLPTGSSVIDKTDIVDGYAHMRRDGSNLTGPSADHLILVLGASTVGTSGNRFLDLELFKSNVEYNKATGVFSNSGPEATGGHTPWLFNANGTISQIGDMDLTFDFSSSAVTEIAVYIWVAKTSMSIVPAGFNFVSTTEFYGNGTNAAYGYAKIVAKNGAALPVWGTVNTSATPAPAWGTNSKESGQASSNYYSSTYAIGQMAEIGIDLTSIGIDMAAFNNGCASPFTRLVIKSRSSSSFTSALSDFAGPLDFLDGPLPPPAIMPPAHLKCNVSSVVLQPQSIIEGSVYNWTTQNGNIISGASSSSITVDKPGKYYLNTSSAVGCTVFKDSVIVTADMNKPIATANRSGVVSENTTATIYGGNEAASNYATPYGGSMGLEWSWTGPLNFTSTQRDNVVAAIGWYTLVVTEKRNGCKDTAIVYVPEGLVLSSKLGTLSAENNSGDISLKWNTITESDIESFEIEKSENGNAFSKAGTVIAKGKSDRPAIYFFNDKNNSPAIFYRLKMISVDGSYKYSNVVTVNNSNARGEMALVYPNPFENKVQIQFQSESDIPVQLNLLSAAGNKIIHKAGRLSKGLNNLSLENLSMLPKGVYIIEIIAGKTVTRTKIIKG